MSLMETNPYGWKTPNKTLLLSDLPDEELLRSYVKFETFAFIMGTISFLFTTFVILRASTIKMEKYKWFLLHEITWSYLFDISFCLWVAVPLFPYQCVFSAGVILRQTNPYLMQHVVKFVIACGVGKGYALFIAFLHRNIQSIPTSILRDHYNNTKHLGKMFFAAWLALEVIIVGPVFVADIRDQVAIREFFSSRDLVIKQIFSQEPSTVCYSLDKQSIIIFKAIGFFITFVFLPIMLNMLRCIMKTRNNVSRSTFRLQWTLFIGICAQVACFYVCFFLPIYVGLWIDLLEVPKAPIISIFLISIACLHSTLDCLILIVFIRPYRRYVFENLLRLIGFGRPTSTSSKSVVTVIAGLEPRTAIELDKQLFKKPINVRT